MFLHFFKTSEYYPTIVHFSLSLFSPFTTIMGSFLKQKQQSTETQTVNRLTWGVIEKLHRGNIEHFKVIYMVIFSKLKLLSKIIHALSMSANVCLSCLLLAGNLRYLDNYWWCWIVQSAQRQIKQQPALEQHQFVTTMHAADVKSQMEIPVMEAPKKTVPDLQINVKMMEHVHLVR